MSRRPDYPAFFGWIGRFAYWLVGWKVLGEMPDYPRLVIIGAPHTSNWDGFVFIFATFYLRCRMNWLGKHTLFRGPFGPIMRLGAGIPVNRKTGKNAVEQVLEAFSERQRMVLAIAPEGTRKKTEHWKTGFYYIALRAKVPIVLAALNYAHQCLEIGPSLMPSGDIEADFKTIAAFYEGKQGRHPEKQGPVLPPPRVEKV